MDNYNHLDSAVTEILPLDTVFAPGIRFEYGGLAKQIAGRMAEVAMGEEFEFLFQKLIAVPLEMTGSHFTPVNTDGEQAGKDVHRKYERVIDAKGYRLSHRP